jgi:hypothetical protein
MDRSWFRIVLTWVVLVPDLVLSYYALKNPFNNLEMTSLALNFVTTTVLFYVYMDIGTPAEAAGEESGPPRHEEVAPTSNKLAFSSLIEDMLVWTGLYFLLYNIVPATLFLHNIIAKNL